MYQALAGLYYPGLKYEQAKALAAKLPAATRAAVVEQAKQYLPSCYIQEFHDCLNDRPTTLPGCSVILEGYAVDWDQMDKIVAQIKYCPPGPSKLALIGGGLALVALGVGIGVLVSK